MNEHCDSKVLATVALLVIMKLWKTEGVCVLQSECVVSWVREWANISNWEWLWMWPVQSRVKFKLHGLFHKVKAVSQTNGSFLPFKNAILTILNCVITDFTAWGCLAVEVGFVHYRLKKQATIHFTSFKTSNTISQLELSWGTDKFRLLQLSSIISSNDLVLSPWSELVLTVLFIVISIQFDILSDWSVSLDYI